MSHENLTRNALQVRAPVPLIAAVKRAGDRDMTSTSEYVRRVLLERLRLDGLDPCKGESE
jgi:hypothetical protein